jgi:hypothetical protein
MLVLLLLAMKQVKQMYLNPLKGGDRMKKYKKFIVVAVALCMSLSISQAIAGPVLWIDDASGNIGTVDVATGVATTIGSAGVVLTDIAFDPSGNLWGVSFTNLYRINKSTGAATNIGSLGLNGNNALVFSSTGILYSASSTDRNLYTINTSTGAATNLGAIKMSANSSGDLAFNGGNLYLSNMNNQLVKIDLSNLTNSNEIGAFGYSLVYGLATAGNGVLYGVSNNTVFSVNTATGLGTFVTNYTGGGLGNAYGSAFYEEAQVPEPATMLLLGLGLVGLAGARRFKK